MSGRYLGIDWGSKRIGVAVSDESGSIAFPHRVITNDANTIESIKKICDKENIKKVVIGESLDYEGRPNKIMKEISKAKKVIEIKTGLSVIFETELLSTKEAEHIQGRVPSIDASAAAVILQSYLDSQNNK